MVTRRDWWLAIALLCGGVFAHAALPRYELRHAVGAESIDYIRYDRWTGQAEWGQFQRVGSVARTVGVRSQRRWLAQDPYSTNRRHRRR
jgi:hypothetical protein